MVTWFVVGIVVLAAVYLVYLYNSLVKTRQMMREGWSGIDVQLKRRADLIPNLVSTVKGYAAHESKTLEEVTAMRAKAAGAPSDEVAARAKAEGALSAALGRLFAVAESYPDLKASQNFAELQQSLERVENDLQMARRYYNGAVRNLNVMVESFPSNLVAERFGFSHAEYFEIEDASDRSTPTVSFSS